MRSLPVSIVLALALLGCAAEVKCADSDDSRILLETHLKSLIADGARIIYSSDLVTKSMSIPRPSIGRDPLESLPQLLEPLGLQVVPGPSGTILIVAAETDNRPPTPQVPVEEKPIPEIVVTSSLHRIEYSSPDFHTYLDRDAAARIPTVGQEVVRLAHRLPGTASGGISSKSHVRGGEDNEVLFLFDGLRLYEPYHLRDFQSVASIVNSSAVGGTDFYTGAYPAHYGDRMSGVLSMEMREANKDVETELALSFFNTSVLSMGQFGSAAQGDWLLSARRGNLDLITDVIKPELGSPDFHDFLGRVTWEFGPRAVLSANILVSDDKVRLADSSRGERARARYSNRVAWLRWDADWSYGQRSRTIVAVSDILDHRDGEIALAGIVDGELDSRRDMKVFEFRQDWTWVLSADWMWSFGANLKHLDAKYRHRSDKVIEPPFDSIFDNQPRQTLSFDRIVDGGQYAAYSEWRWRASDGIVVDLGIRWDQQTYTVGTDDRQYSPRASVLWQAGENTEVRLGWGQYYQAQETNELQLSDGNDQFFPAQRAEHFVASLRRQLAKDTDIEISAFRKSFRTLRPRYENAFNVLTLVPEIQFDRIRVDPRKAESHGAEITISRGAADDTLIWWASYSWAQTRDWTSEGKISRSWDQTHAIKAGLSWNRGRWDLSWAFDAHTGWPTTKIFPVYQSNPDGTTSLHVSTTPRNKLRYSTFSSLDFRASRSVAVRRGELTTFIEITNALNRANACCTEYSISNDGELKARIRHWLPLVPSLGLVWRF